MSAPAQPRATLALLRAARAEAAPTNRQVVTPSDVALALTPAAWPSLSFPGSSFGFRGQEGMKTTTASQEGKEKIHEPAHTHLSRNRQRLAHPHRRRRHPAHALTVMDAHIRIEPRCQVSFHAKLTEHALPGWISPVVLATFRLGRLTVTAHAPTGEILTAEYGVRTYKQSVDDTLFWLAHSGEAAFRRRISALPILNVLPH
jgi:hypothetical protein